MAGKKIYIKEDIDSLQIHTVVGTYALGKALNIAANTLRRQLSKGLCIIKTGHIASYSRREVVAKTSYTTDELFSRGTVVVMMLGAMDHTVTEFSSITKLIDSGILGPNVWRLHTAIRLYGSHVMKGVNIEFLIKGTRYSIPPAKGIAEGTYYEGSMARPLYYIKKGLKGEIVTYPTMAAVVKEFKLTRESLKCRLRTDKVAFVSKGILISCDRELLKNKTKYLQWELFKMGSVGLFDPHGELVYESPSLTKFIKDNRDVHSNYIMHKRILRNGSKAFDPMVLKFSIDEGDWETVEPTVPVEGVKKTSVSLGINRGLGSINVLDLLTGITTVINTYQEIMEIFQSPLMLKRSLLGGGCRFIGPNYHLTFDDHAVMDKVFHLREGMRGKGIFLYKPSTKRFLAKNRIWSDIRNLCALNHGVPTGYRESIKDSSDTFNMSLRAKGIVLGITIGKLTLIPVGKDNHLTVVNLENITLDGQDD